MKIGEEIKFCGYDWYVIDTNEEETVLMMKDILSAEEIKKYCKDDVIMYGGSCVRYNDNIRYNEWEKSYIYKVLNGEFLEQNKELKENILEIRLPKKEEIEALDDYEIRKASDWYWTCTPYEDDNEGYIKRAFYVTVDGRVYNYHVFDDDYSLRPAVVCSSAIFESKKEGDKNPFVDLEELPKNFTLEDNTSELSDTDWKISIISIKINEIIDVINELRNKDEKENN